MTRVGSRSSGRTRSRVVVEGAVQGVGYRPFVHGLATRLGLAGFVANDTNGVFVEIEGTRDQVDRFTETLRSQAPPLAEV
jgi:hydrogenase maturation protein HypF